MRRIFFFAGIRHISERVGIRQDVLGIEKQGQSVYCPYPFLCEYFFYALRQFFYLERFLNKAVTATF